MEEEDNGCHLHKRDGKEKKEVKEIYHMNL